MVSKLISISVTSILILLVMGAMVWQVAPVLAGITPSATPTTTPTATPTTTPTATPTTTPIPPTATPIPPAPPAEATPTPPTETTPTPTATPYPLLPVSGAQASGPNNSEIIAVSLAGGLVLLLAAISLAVRKSARTRTDK